MSQTQQNKYMWQKKILIYYINLAGKSREIERPDIASSESKVSTDLNFNKQQTMSKKLNSALNKTRDEHRHRKICQNSPKYEPGPKTSQDTILDS